MPLAGYDVVLSTNWMAPLGDIIWNLAAGTMAFKHAGRDVCWRSLAPPSPPRLHVATPTTEPLLDGLLDSFDDVFAAPTGLRRTGVGLTVSPSSPARPRWQSGRTATPPLTKTSWRSNARP